MTSFEIEMKKLRDMTEARGAFYAARMAYARSLGSGTNTKAQHDELLALKADWEQKRAA